LLLRRSGRCDDGHVDALAKALGCLPLALVQAAAYIEATGESFGGYLELFEESGVEVFNDPSASPSLFPWSCGGSATTQLFMAYILGPCTWPRKRCESARTAWKPSGIFLLP
jgi:hypothetical protein